MLAATQAALADVRRLKALEKRPVKAVISRAVLPHALEALRPSIRDFQAASHVRELSFDSVTEPQLVFEEERSAQRSAARDRDAPAVAPLALEDYQDTVRAALAEDIGAGDVTTARHRGPGAAGARGPGGQVAAACVAGLDVAGEAFRQRDAGVSIVRHRADGDWCEPGTVVAEVRGPRGGAAERRARGAQLPAAAVGHGHAGARGSPTLPAAASWSWTHGRPRRCCACWRSTPCAWAAPPTIASAWTTAC